MYNILDMKITLGRVIVTVIVLSLRCTSYLEANTYKL